MTLRHILALVLLAATTLAHGATPQLPDSARTAIVRALTGKYWRSDKPILITTVNPTAGGGLRIDFNAEAADLLLDTARIAEAKRTAARLSGTKGKVSLTIAGTAIERHLPPGPYAPKSTGKPLVGRGEGALCGRHIALWNSHGRYYEQSLDRWEWQRARLFTTVEDLLSSGFVLPFLLPMLENAGATVLLPRERDMQSTSATADNQQLQTNGAVLLRSTRGYKAQATLHGTDNPFAQGTADIYSLRPTDTLRYSIAAMPKGEYGVHVCYAANATASDSVTYHITCGTYSRRYTVNQQRGGGMWIYLGTCLSDGTSDITVDITGQGEVSADAIRIGGGLGCVERGGRTSGAAAWMEAARYHLQANGFDTEVYSPSNGKNDYTDDINCRGNWVNALRESKNIPIDIAVALHTDAGIAQADSTIGTLTLISTNYNGIRYADGRSRTQAKALAYSIEQTMLHDMRALWDTCWSERGVRDRGYSESKRPDVPSLIIEVLSHQNLRDMRYALHPQFRFDACRAIYKGIARYLEGNDAVIAPLPISNIGMRRTAHDTITISWCPTLDPLEPSAMPTSYDIYIDDNLRLTTTDTCAAIHQPCDGTTARYRIVARNAGGQSMPSAELAASLRNDAPLALLVEGFDRVSSPSTVSTEHWGGIVSDDPGVAWQSETFSTGGQHNFDTHSPWTDDDSPGWGASHADCEGVTTYGSRGCHTAHASQSLREQGASFVSCTKQWFDADTDSLGYDIVHIALGNQRTTWYGHSEPRHRIYTRGFMRHLSALSRHAKQITIGGSYIGTDITTPEAEQFAARVLGIKHRANHATLSGVAEGNGQRIDIFNRQANQCRPIPDAIEPAAKGARTIMRYTDTQMSAAVKYRNITTYGF